jgi:hypothetical protein
MLAASVLVGFCGKFSLGLQEVEMKRAFNATLLVVMVLLSLTVAAQNPPVPGNSLLQPFSSREEVEQFLRTAKIVKSRGTPRGITNPDRLTLDNGQVQHDAVFKRIDERKTGVTKLQWGVEFDFKDSWKFEVAAYEIDKLLNLNMVPVTVAREYRGDWGSLQYWIENCILEKDRLEKKLKPPNPVLWNWQIYKVRIFDQLIYNIDRNLGNILVTPDFRCVMIDHSRSFKNIADLQSPKEMQYFSRSLMEALSKLDEAALKAKCGTSLTDPEISMTLKRRDRIMEYYQRMVREKGDGILFP